MNVDLQIEQGCKLPLVNLLWTILTKCQKSQNIQKIPKNDVFAILAAVLDFQVSEMLGYTDCDDENAMPTSNPLLYRNHRN